MVPGSLWEQTSQPGMGRSLHVAAVMAELRWTERSSRSDTEKRGLETCSWPHSHQKVISKDRPRFSCIPMGQVVGSKLKIEVLVSLYWSEVHRWPGGGTVVGRNGLRSAVSLLSRERGGASLERQQWGAKGLGSWVTNPYSLPASPPASPVTRSSTLNSACAFYKWTFVILPLSRSFEIQIS